MNNFFEILRPGINSTFQDSGRNNLSHIGIPSSGAMDKRNYLLANSLVGNKLDFPVIEFAMQGPLIKYNGNDIFIAITGDVIFKIKKKEKEIIGNCFENYLIEDGDTIDVISTNKSVYGYLAISGKLNIKPQWESFSVNTKANIGANNGEKIITNCGFGCNISNKAELLSRLTSAQSTLCLNDTSVTKFERSRRGS